MKKKILSLALAAGLALGALTVYANDYAYVKPLDRPGNLAVGDLTGDNKPEIVYLGLKYGTEDSGCYAIVIEENFGNMSFKRHTRMEGLPIEGHFRNKSQINIKIVDIDNDGLNDILIKTDEYMAVFKNKGDLEFQQKRLY